MNDFSIACVATVGTPPMCLHSHTALLKESTFKIVCTGGNIVHLPSKFSVENITTWELDIATHTWSERETKPYTRWLLMREDEGMNDLFRIERVTYADLLASRFKPPIPHTTIKKDWLSDEYGTYRILVDDVVVRYVQDYFDIAVTVEGALSDDKLEVLARHGLEMFAKLEGVPYKKITL